ncbi:MAG: hypothetical protein ABIJ59_14355 [Pseudomonadota bacterium]
MKLKSSAKASGGYWSRYKNEGAIAGFLFKSRATADEFIGKNSGKVVGRQAGEVNIGKPIGLKNQILDAVEGESEETKKQIAVKLAYVKDNIDKIIKINGDRVYDISIDDKGDLYYNRRETGKNENQKYYYPIKYANIEYLETTAKPEKRALKKPDEVTKYINAIKSTDKKQYAKDYYSWLKDGKSGVEPENPNVSYMAKQAVRMSLDKFMGEQKKPLAIPEKELYQYTKDEWIENEREFWKNRANPPAEATWEAAHYKAVKKAIADGITISDNVLADYPDLAPKVEKVSQKVEVITDPAEVQELKNSIAEGEQILKSGKKDNGEPYSVEGLEVVRRSVINAKNKIGDTSETPGAKYQLKKPEVSLDTEAKKYKTADEFVKSKDIVYHGSDTKIDKFDIGRVTKWKKFGHFFTTKKEFATNFGENINEAVVNIKNPKIINYEQWNEIRGEHAKDADWFANWKNELKAQGFDGLNIKGSKEKVGKFDVENPEILVVFEDSQVQTKSQLTDIWEKAHAKVSEAPTKYQLKKPGISLEEAKKYKTVDEFVESKSLGWASAETNKPFTAKAFHGSPDARFAEEFDPQKKGYFPQSPEALPYNVGFEELHGGIRQGFRDKSVTGNIGVSFSKSQQVARSYANKPAFDYQNSVPMVLERYITLNNPKVIDFNGGNWNLKMQEEIDSAIKEGHDGLIFKNIKDNYYTPDSKIATDNVIVFDKKNIKSKSQLTDVWERAHAKVSKPTIKYQLKQTESPEFKKWFGNSKVVDENGKPLVVYHGSPEKFNVFSYENVGAQGTTEGYGFYFTPDKNIAKGYAEKRGEGKLFEIYLKIENPASNEKRTISKADLKKILKELHNNDPDFALSNYGDIDYYGLNQVLNEAVNLENNAESDTEIIGSLVNGGIGTIEDVLSAVYKITKKDGVITKWGGKDGAQIMVAFSPTQIKSAIENIGTFDATIPDIRYQEGLRPEVSTQAEQLQVVKDLLPELDVKAVEKITTPDGKEALGRFLNGIIEISKNPSESTGDHEVVHGYLNLYISEQRKLRIFDSWRKETGKANLSNETVEEEIAEHFHDHRVKGTRPKSFLFRMFAKLKAIVKRLLGKTNEVESLYDDILSQKRPKRAQETGVAQRSMQMRPLSPTFFGQMEKVVTDKFPAKMAGKSVVNWLRNNQVKPEELDWMDVESFVANKLQVTKEQLLDFIRRNDVQVEEVVKGYNKNKIEYAQRKIEELEERRHNILEKEKPYTDNNIDVPQNLIDEAFEIQDWIENLRHQIITADETKFSQYQTPGGKNYREILLTMPERGKLVYTVDNVIPIKPSEKDIFGEPIASESNLFWYFRTPDNVLKISKKKYPSESDAYEYVIREKSPEAPADQNFISSHFTEPNILAHVRFNERTDADGNRVLFLEEVQSDIAQKGKEKGYSNPKERQRINELADLFLSDRSKNQEGTPERIEYEHLVGKNKPGSVPNQPFKSEKSWSLLVFKRMIRYAAENNFDKIAWTTGTMQIGRYDLSNYISSVKATKGDYGYTIKAEDLYGGVITGLDNEIIVENKLSSVVGKELAKKIINDGGGKYTGLDLQVGGEGMKTFYDQKIPAFVNKYVKKWGGKVEETTIGNMTVPSITITPAMKSAALYEGQPKFQRIDKIAELEALKLDLENKYKRFPIQNLRRLIDRTAEEIRQLKETPQVDEVKTPETLSLEGQDLMDAYETQKDIWFGNKDVRILQAQIEKQKIQAEIKSSLGEKKYTDNVKDYDKAIQLYIDTKRNPEHISEYSDKLTDEQRKILELSQNLPENIKTIADKIEASYKELGLEALEQDVIRNVLDNYAGRIWDIEGKVGAENMRKFGTTTRHAKARTFDTIIEGWANGYNLKVEGAANNLGILKEEIIKTIEDKKFIKALQKLKTIDGEPLLTTNQLPEYKQVEHPNFKVWKWAGSAEEGKTYGKNFFIDKDGNLFEKQALYSPESVAKNMNNILGISKLKGIPFIDAITKFNATTKAWILQTSLFHHLAFTRSYWFGTHGKKWSDLSPRQAYRNGLKMIENENPIVLLGVKNGLTLGLKQDWEEELLREKGVISKTLDRWKVSKVVKDKIMEFREAQANFLFGKYGAGLKAKSFTLEYGKLLKKHPNMDTDKAAKMVANLINDDFGGLHLQRMGRNPTVQHMFRMFALASDWTESNIRTMVKAVKAGGKEESELYRRFWAGIFTKAIGLTVIANLLMAKLDDDDEDTINTWQRFVRNYKQAWDTGGFRFLEVDITPLYKALGGKTEKRKYFSILGHFKDPIKFIFYPPRSAHHKGSVVYRFFYEIFSGEDWAGRRFTKTGELLGIDYDKGLYKTTRRGLYRKGDPKWGKLKGKTVTWDFAGKGSIGWDQVPSFMLHQIKGWQPIQIQNLLSWWAGEQEGFDAVGNSLGLGIRTTYGDEEPKKRKLKKPGPPLPAPTWGPP